jgi:hypothetical protein
VSKLGGGILTAAGIVVAGASGLCSITVLDLGNGISHFDATGLAIVGTVGGIPFLIGLLMLGLGIRELKRTRRESDSIHVEKDVPK